MTLSHRPAAWSALASVFIFAACFNASAQTTRVPARVTEAVDPQKLITLPGNVHPLVRPENDQGLVADSTPMGRLLLVLKRSPDQETALRQLLVNQQVKSSPGYHQWLTPQQFGQQYGPADADVQAVADWLSSQGFAVSRVASGRGTIEFSGTAGLVRQALHTEIHHYLVNGRTYLANASNPQIPAALAPVVAGVASLNTFPRRPMYHRVGTFERSKGSSAVKPLFTYTCPTSSSACGTGTFYAVGPNDFGTIYNVQPAPTTGTGGTGVTIAVVAQSNINCQDLASFRQLFGLPYTATSSTNPCPNNFNVILDGPDPGIVGPSTPTDDEGEAILDAEWSGVAAPAATVDLVVSESPTTTQTVGGVDLSALYIVDNNLAPILSYSYGSCEDGLTAEGNAFYASLWEQAAAQGITVLVAAGDNGSAACDGFTSSGNLEIAAINGLAVNGLASTPYNVVVGGTDFNDTSSESTYWSSTNNSTTQTSAMSYIPETTWNNSGCAQSEDYTNCNPDPGGADLVGGAGGPSNCAFLDASENCTGGYSKPSWQTGSGVPNDGVRDLPDVSLFAGNGVNGSFYVVCEADANLGTNTTSCDLNSPYVDFQGVGGTSAAVQAFAGVIALVVQKTGQRQGNANYILYPLAAQAASNGNYCASNSSSVSNTSCIFYDVNPGGNASNSVACVSGSLHCSNPAVSTGPSCETQVTAGCGYGILVNPPASNSPAWLAGSGYDQATGLGTVNVANLVNNWSSVSFQPSSISVTVNGSSTGPVTGITHGQNVTIAARVIAANGAGTPTGDVGVIACSVNTSPCPHGSVVNSGGVDYNTLSGGTVSWQTAYLPGGTYYVEAHYAGDGKYGSSDSNAVQVTVGKEGSEVGVCLTNSTSGPCPLTANPASVTYGTAYVLRIDVENSNSQPCSTATSPTPCPTGPVKLLDNGAQLPSNEDQGAPPSNTPGQYNLNSQGFAEDQYLQLTAGTHALVGNYQGDNSYNSSSSVMNTITVAQASTTIALTDTATGGGAYTLTATVSTSSNGAAPSGTVTFNNGGTALSGTPVYTGTPYNPSTGTNASATWVLTYTFTAAATITATYSGDTNYTGSGPSNSVSISASPDFGLAATTTTATVTAGNSATYPLSITSAFSFNSAVTLTCSVATPLGFSGTLPTCSLSPSSVTPAANQSSPSTLMVNTTAQSLVPPAGHHGPRIVPLPLLIPLAMILLASIGLAMKRRRALAAAMLAGTLLLLALGLASCGGGSSGGGGGTPPPTGTPSGTYSITVTGTSGSLTHTASVTLTVQ